MLLVPTAWQFGGRRVQSSVKQGKKQVVLELDMPLSDGNTIGTHTVTNASAKDLDYSIYRS